MGSPDCNENADRTCKAKAAVKRDRSPFIAYSRRGKWGGGVGSGSCKRNENLLLVREG